LAGQAFVPVATWRETDEFLTVPVQELLRLNLHWACVESILPHDSAIVSKARSISNAGFKYGFFAADSARLSVRSWGAGFDSIP